MDDKQIDILLETAQKIFVSELKGKTEQMEQLITMCRGNFSESDTRQILRFFHSINGTASTLGLDYLSSIGKNWEEKIKCLSEQGVTLDKGILQEMYIAIKTIKEKIGGMGDGNVTSDVLNTNGEYINMPDRGKVLLVDDDITILKLLENAFTLEGYKVYICEDSFGAMDAVAVTRPDIVILDIMMSGLSGYEIVEKIKSNPEYSEMHLIFLSAKGDIDDKIKGIKSGVDDYITKPFVIGEVITRVEMIMRRSRNYKEKLLKDCLTGAYSRYYFNLRIAEELERYRRNGTLFSIAFLDLDHYKNINDQYGHQAGDHALKGLVSHISGNIRGCDSIFRYGGEEFVVLMPDTTEEKAYTVIDRLRQGFCDEPVSVDDMPLSVTFSAGIKQVRDKDESVEQLISDADKAMYCAKRCGRNKVVVYSNEMESQSLKKTLLIVDDENTILKLLYDRLTNIGYNVITAKDGKSAIKLAIEAKPDVILLDLILPDTDGFEVCSQIKKNIAARSSKIIMLSKKKQKKTIVKGLHLGADDYVTKPFSMEELEARILKVLNNIG